MQFDIKTYLTDHHLTIYKVAKVSGYGYTTLHKAFNKEQTQATPINIRDLDALAKTQDLKMWEVLKELETNYQV